MKKEITINIIRDDYVGDHKEALSYCWSDFEKKESGIDVTVSATGVVDYVAIAKKAMKDNDAETAYVNCMWGHGFSGLVTADQEEVIEVAEKKEAGITIEEEVAHTQLTEKYSDYDKKNHVGWCDKCKSYCYGDCQSN